MEQSLTLLSAQVHFLDTSLSLIHIPLELYNTFLQPIIQLLLPAKSSDILPVSDPNPSTTNARSRRPWAYEHPFVNVSLTPVECSVVCSEALARQLFEPVRNSLPQGVREQVSISAEQYVVIQVDGEGLDAGQRVLELTSPLAMNGISIFFITTYFSDYILVPQRSRSTVIKALEERGFAFSEHTEAFVNIASPLMQPAMTQHHRNSSSTSSFDSQYFPSIGIPIDQSTQPLRAPSTPPPSSVAELQTRTFALLKRRNVVPRVDRTIQLVQCAGRKDTLRGGEGAHASSTTSTLLLHLGLVQSLTATPRPRFLSLTLTDTEPASLLLERRLLVNFGDGVAGSGDDVLLGSKEDVLIPITLDLRDLPMESPGIVCGIAGRLVGGTSTASGELGDDQDGAVEMSYLSTALAGNVMVAETELERALAALRGGESNGVGVVHTPLNGPG